MSLPFDCLRSRLVPAQAMLIVVSGHSRGVGKTFLVEAILKAFPSYRFSTLKISAHRHGAGEAQGPAQECNGADERERRLLNAGAESAWLLRARDETFPHALPAIEELLARTPNWIVESNRLVKYLKPDLLLFVWRPEIADWKPSSDACVASCDAVVLRDVKALRQLAGNPLRGRAPILLQPEPGVLAAQSIEWLARRRDFLETRPCDA